MKIKYLVILLVFTAFLIHGVTQLDSDFGWHLRMGEVILKSGIPKVDQFSYSMPSYPFVDISWLSGTFIAFLFPKTGMIGLSFVYALITMLSFFIVLSIRLRSQGIIKPSSLIGVVLLIFGASAILPFEAVRVQAVSWFFIAIILKIFLEQDNWSKRRYFLPVIFLLWANLHGSFSVGLVVLFIGVLARSFRIKAFKTSDLMVLGISALFTFINPYGLSLYGEVGRTLWGSNLSGKVAEWQPFFFTFNFAFLAFLPVSLASVWYFRNKHYLEEIILFIGFFVAAMLSQRHIPLLILFSIPILLFGYDQFYLKLKNIKYGLERLGKTEKFVFVCSLILFLVIFFTYTVGSMTENNYYPAKAVNYLKINTPQGQIFSQYTWGGYLIWKFPEKKVFIDGRMCTWSWMGPVGESSDIMKDNEAIILGKTDYKQIFEEYGITTVLWAKSNSGSVLDKVISNFNRLLVKEKEEPFDFIGQIKKDGWQKVYEDSVSVIYRMI